MMKLASALIAVSVGVSAPALAAVGTAPKTGSLVSPSKVLTARGWIILTGTSDTLVYMKRTSSPKEGLRRVWTAYDSSVEKIREGSRFRSVASLGEFDCAKRVTRTIEERFHERSSLTGRAWRDPKFVATDWATPQPGTIGAIRLAFVCQAQVRA